MQNCKVNILGTEYSIVFKDDEEVANNTNSKVGDVGGYCDMQKHLIVIAKMNMDSTDEETTEKIKKQNLRHECIHAFFMESGLAFNSNSTDNWAVNEEMIDWFAIQAPKIFKVFQELDIL